MNVTAKTNTGTAAGILSGCISHQYIHDEIIDKLYANAFEITSEKEYLASCGFNTTEISKWYQHKANRSLKQRIIPILKKYNNQQEEFLSSHDNVSVKAIWRNGELYFTILHSHFLSKQSNASVQGFEGLGMLSNKHPGESTAFTVPKHWLIASTN